MLTWGWGFGIRGGNKGEAMDCRCLDCDRNIIFRTDHKARCKFRLLDWSEILSVLPKSLSRRIQVIRSTHKENDHAE